MRRLVVALALAVVSAASAGAPASAATERLTCANDTGGFGQREVRFGPAWVRAVNGYADPEFFATRLGDDGLYWAKAPLSLRRGVTATVSIGREDRRFADFVFGGARRGDVVRVKACPRNGRRGEAGYTSWAGGYLLTEPRCVDVVARVSRTRAVYRATLSFGMGDACARTR